jgi:ABC-type phosphate transport system auxiliary subunit
VVQRSLCGYPADMTETPKQMHQEAGSGRSERTPWLALSGVAIVVALVVGVILVIAFLFYFLA